MNIQPLGDYVFLMQEAKEESSFGIVLLDTPSTEFIVECGGGFAQGDKVVLAPSASLHKVHLDGKDYTVVDKKYILCTI